MKLFEATFRTKYDYFERYYCTIQKKSIKKRIDIPAEWYTETSTGLYSYILDDTVKLEKKQGRATIGRDEYGFCDPMYRNIRDNYWSNPEDGDTRADGYNNDFRTWYLDLETRVGVNSTGFPIPEKALEQISLIQIFDGTENTMYIFGLRDWTHKDDYEFDYPVKYIKCKDEIELLESYLDLFATLDPLVIYAWNGSGFDYPYLFNRIKNLGINTQRLSNYGSVRLTENTFKGRTTFKFSTDGHFYIDLMKVYEKFTFKSVTSYSLDNIGFVELKQKKIQHTEYAAFDDFYTGKYIIPINPTEEQKNSKIYKAAILGDFDEVKELAHSEFVYYGAIDTHLVYQIDKKKNFSVLQKMIAEKMGVQFSDSMGTVKPWSQYISNCAMKNNQVLPPKQENEDSSITGGYVRDVIKGRHKWIVSADVNSMYPLLGMVGFNMSPETFIPKSKLSPELRDIVLTHFNDQDEGKRFDIPEESWEKITKVLNDDNVSLGVNGAVFDNSVIGLIPKLVQTIYNKRKITKGTQLGYEERKVQIGEIIKKRKALI